MKSNGTLKDNICLNLAMVHFAERVDDCDIAFNFGFDDWKNVTYETIEERDAEWDKITSSSL